MFKKFFSRNFLLVPFYLFMLIAILMGVSYFFAETAVPTKNLKFEKRYFDKTYIQIGVINEMPTLANDFTGSVYLDEIDIYLPEDGFTNYCLTISTEIDKLNFGTKLYEGVNIEQIRDQHVERKKFEHCHRFAGPATITYNPEYTLTEDFECDNQAFLFHVDYSKSRPKLASYQYNNYLSYPFDYGSYVLKIWGDIKTEYRLQGSSVACLDDNFQDSTDNFTFNQSIHLSRGSKQEYFSNIPVYRSDFIRDEDDLENLDYRPLYNPNRGEWHLVTTMDYENLCLRPEIFETTLDYYKSEKGCLLNVSFERPILTKILYISIFVFLLVFSGLILCIPSLEGFIQGALAYFVALFGIKQLLAPNFSANFMLTDVLVSICFICFSISIVVWAINYRKIRKETDGSGNSI